MRVKVHPLPPPSLPLATKSLNNYPAKHVLMILIFLTFAKIFAVRTCII